MQQREFEDSESEDFVFLTGCADEQEASMLESFLACENIFVLRKYEGAGDYLRIACGMTIFGIDLFVKRSQLGLAKEILGEVMGTMDIDKTNNKPAKGTVKNSAVPVQNNSNNRVFIIAGIVLIIIVSFLLAMLFNFHLNLIDYEILGK